MEDNLKIMIADDEKWVRTAIMSLIPFEKLGMTLACEAANGIEALELCSRHKPDILLTDIMMPGLTGLDLIKELRNNMPGIRIAIISGYSDFEYAKTAMKYGISDYILKPVDENELLQVLERFKSDIGEEIRQNRKKTQEEERYKSALPVISEVFLNRIIAQNTLTAETIKGELTTYGINFTGQLYSIAVLAPDDIRFETGKDEAYYRNCIKRVMKRYLGAVTFQHSGENTKMVSIINTDEPETDKICSAFELCLRFLKKRLGITLSAGLSLPTRQLAMLQHIYLQAEKTLKKRFWEGPGCFGLYEQGILSEFIPFQLTEDILNKITLNLKLSNIKTALSYIDEVYEKLEQTNNIDPDQIKEFFWQLIQSIISMLNIQISFIRHDSHVTGEQPYEVIRNTLFLDRLAEYSKDMVRRIFDFYHDKNPVNNSNMIDNAKKVIESNYAGDISLEQVARHVHLSPAYLSELFKKETGMSFIDFKTIVRIENAKRLLLTSSMNIYEVSSRVGYSDPKYFSKLFKKITGKTVYEFRKEAADAET